jgi:hypothetical protein
MARTTGIRARTRRNSPGSLARPSRAQRVTRGATGSLSTKKGSPTERVCVCIYVYEYEQEREILFVVDHGVYSGASSTVAPT